MSSMEYLLTMGVVIVAFVGTAFLLMRALVASHEIEALFFTLPFG